MVILTAVHIIAFTQLHVGVYLQNDCLMIQNIVDLAPMSRFRSAPGQGDHHDPPKRGPLMCPPISLDKGSGWG